jgi:glycosyltransferase involved in cell wall biosynthesis
MLFLVHSEINANTIQSSLGMPEYSYYFVLKTYVDVLQELGRVIRLDNPLQQADALYDEAQRNDEPCVFIAFAPPHRAPLGLRCPTLCVFAWEFSNLPDRAWENEPRNDWRHVLRQHGRTITLSSHTAEVVRQTMGDDYPVRAIPVPVFDAQPSHDTGPTPRHPPSGMRSLHLSCTIIDSRHYDISAEHFINHTPATCLRLPAADATRLTLRFDLSAHDHGLLGGFYEPESWGIWSRISAPWLLLPRQFDGRYRIALELTAYGPNVGRSARMSIGAQIQPLPLSDDFVWHEFDFDITPDDRLIQFDGLDTSGIAHSHDPRGMGIGLRSLWIEPLSSESLSSKSMPPPSAPHPAATASPLDLRLDGVVYTSVLNPGDDRKNWGDMLTAFCHAFADEPNATLILKMTHHALASFLGRFHYLLQRIGPVKCRIVLLHGFLDDTAYHQLAAASTYCVNTSRCEGLCLPLMEYMSLGILAVAPRHTAMLDYISADNSFIVASSLEPGVWPHDPEARLGTLRQRIDWRSLVDAFRDSFRVARHEPARYQTMSTAARAAQRHFCSRQKVRDSLREFLCANDRSAA